MQEIALGIVVTDGKILLIDIPVTDREFPGMVGFPGGDIREREKPVNGCKRLIEQKTHVETRRKQKIGTVEQTIKEFNGRERDVLIHVFEMEAVDIPENLPQHAFMIEIDHLDRLELAPSNLSIFEEMYKHRNPGAYLSTLQRNPLGEYVQTRFERKER